VSGRFDAALLLLVTRRRCCWSKVSMSAYLKTELKVKTMVSNGNEGAV
jgi:hypothetical protein